MSDTQSFTWRDRLIDCLARILICLALILPYRARVPMMGWLMRRVVGPVIGARARVINNLAHIWPDMPAFETRQIATAVLDNTGRILIENYSTSALLARAEAWEPKGPGLTALAEAQATGRPVLLITGHFGNYEAARAALTVRGYSIGGLYRPMNNGYFNRHYVRTMESFGGPVFPRGPKGLRGFVRHLKQGRQGVLLIDQYFATGALLDYLGKPAPTSTSAAEIALKYDAALIPFYATRLKNGLDFEVALEAPVAHSDAITMTQALNDSLSAKVRDNPAQWFWLHRRWKPERQARHFEQSES
ncbi:lysophospholipid acyltransferase family protein [Rhodophyticola sp. CCM32]|uniref:lysophospholipid acyltransferase family protein n=1 Tax=Rhodophyticola sp. CCM32 TaxID=2916397 RepID=UPI001EE4ED6A|nr:lysophospholipid acyltransferase family protein [Rhodophyticola sp. CCM32]